MSQLSVEQRIEDLRQQFGDEGEIKLADVPVGCVVKITTHHGEHKYEIVLFDKNKEFVFIKGTHHLKRFYLCYIKGALLPDRTRGHGEIQRSAQLQFVCCRIDSKKGLRKREITTSPVGQEIEIRYDPTYLMGEE